MNQPSGLLRAIDPRYPSNLLAVGLAVAGGSLALLRGFASDDALIDSFVAAVISGVAVFMSWAIARELDPDHPGSAALAGVFALIGMQFVEPTYPMLALIPVLLTLRSIARTTGVPLIPFDIAALVFWWAFGLILLVLRLDIDLKLEGVTIIGLGGILLFNLYAEWGMPPTLNSVGDRTQEPLERYRVKLAVQIAGVIVAVFLLTSFPDVIMPLSVVSYAICLYALYLRGSA